MPAGQHPFGVKLQYDLDGTPPYTDLTTVRSVGGIDIVVGSSLVTHLESPSAFAEKIPGWADGGKVPFVLIATKAQINTIRTTLYRVIYKWRLLWPLLSGEMNASRWDFDGHWTRLHEMEKVANSDEPIMTEFEIDITGPPVFTVGS